MINFSIRGINPFKIHDTKAFGKTLWILKQVSRRTCRLIFIALHQKKRNDSRSRLCRISSSMSTTQKVLFPFLFLPPNSIQKHGKWKTFNAQWYIGFSSTKSWTEIGTRGSFFSCLYSCWHETLQVLLDIGLKMIPFIKLLIWGHVRRGERNIERNVKKTSNFACAILSLPCNQTKN